MDNLESTTLKYPLMYRGLVEDNLDSSKLGRCKVRAYPMFANMSVDGLPWSVPAQPILSGSGAGFGSFAVPEVGSYVFVFFENGDPYQPVYFAEAPTAGMGLPAARKTAVNEGDPEDYPFIKVNRTKNGIQIKINDHYDAAADPAADNRDVRIDHPSGSWVEFYPDGRVTLHTTTAAGKVLIEADNADIELLAKKGNIDINATEGDISATAAQGDIFVEATLGSADVTAGTEITINAPIVSINPV
jgi:hypothetical protein